MNAQSNQLDFAERLRKLEQRKTVAVNRGMVSESLSSSSKNYGKKEKKKRSFFLLKSVIFLVLFVFGYRFATLTMGVDLEQRRAELSEGTRGQKIASAVVGVSMIADPYLLPLFGIRSERSAAADTDDLEADTKSTLTTSGLLQSMVVNKPSGITLTASDGSNEKVKVLVAPKK